MSENTSYGFVMDLKKDTSNASARLATIIEGGHADYTNLANTTKNKDYFSSRTKITSPPRIAKHIQIKRYCIDENKKYLFCICISADENVFSQIEGVNTISHQDVFINYLAVLTCLRRLDFIFFLPLKLESSY